MQYRYEYDAKNQLTREDNRPLGYSYVYTYDNNGNMLSRQRYAFSTGTLSGTPTTDTFAHTNPPWQDLLMSINGTGISYDHIGNPTSYKGATLTWEGRRLTKYVSGSATYTYTYNDEGIRTKKVVLGTTHDYALDGSKILAETVGGTVYLYLYDESGSPIGFQIKTSSSTATYLYEKNLQGDIVGLYTSTGTKLATYKYDAWGNVTTVYASGITNAQKTAVNVNPFRYRGYYYDTETGFYYLNSRYYDPSICRFINADKYVSTEQDITGYNMFAYCGNNPVNRVDPAGTFWKEIGDFFSSAWDAVEKTSSIIFTADFALHLGKSAFENLEVGAGVGFGIGISSDVLGPKIELVTRMDAFSIQLIDGKVRIGNIGRSALSIGLGEWISIGPQSDTFEDHLTGSSQKYEPRKYWYTIGPSYGVTNGFIVCAHIEASWDMIGFAKDLYTYIEERW